MITAQEAHRIGLVNEVTAPANLIPRAEAIAQKIIANAPLAVQYAMEAVNKGMEMTLAEGYISRHIVRSVLPTETKEGTTDIFEKRAAQFKDVSLLFRKFMRSRFWQFSRRHRVTQ